LATYLLRDGESQRSPSFLRRNKPSARELFGSDAPSDVDPTDFHRLPVDAIPEISIPSSLVDNEAEAHEDGPSVLSNLLRQSPPESVVHDAHTTQDEPSSAPPSSHAVSSSTPPASNQPRKGAATETTPLLWASSPDARSEIGGDGDDLEGQKAHSKSGASLDVLAERARRLRKWLRHDASTIANPRQWSPSVVWEKAVVAPASCLPAVAVGLLLNILDALSYGKSHKPML
jgi:SulP family sulfate permease